MINDEEIIKAFNAEDGFLKNILKKVMRRHFGIHVGVIPAEDIKYMLEHILIEKLAEKL